MLSTNDDHDSQCRRFNFVKDVVRYFCARRVETLCYQVSPVRPPNGTIRTPKRSEPFTGPSTVRPAERVIEMYHIIMFRGSPDNASRRFRRRHGVERTGLCYIRSARGPRRAL